MQAHLNPTLTPDARDGRRAVLMAGLGLGLAMVAGCANVAKVSTGDNLVGGRVQLSLNDAWNQVNIPGSGRAVVWTQDGVPLDALEFWVGVKDGEELGRAPRDKRPLTFRASMSPHELAALVEAFHARDGSTFTQKQLAPVPFLGQGAGTRLDFELLRKSDDVRALGVAWFAVIDRELHLMTFTAPRLGFFPRHLPKVEQAAASARLVK